MAGAKARSIPAAVWHGVRHPTRRGIALLFAALPVLLLVYVLALIPLTPRIGDIRKARIDRPALVLSADGYRLAEFKEVNREWVPLAQISPYVVQALVATEDRRFYQHHGIDFQRLASAALHTFSGTRQGGSTITQQLARNLYPDEVGRAPTLTRKLKEAITALKIEFVYSKGQILETYLNTVPFLYNAYGVEMAARTYFGKPAAQLNILESATLVGMLKANSAYNPVLNPERALERRNTVLEQMVKFGKLKPADCAWLKRQPLGVDFEVQTEAPGSAPHFAAQLRRWLIGWADRNGYDIYADGLVVRTTIDSRLQDMAMRALAWQTGQLQEVANAAWNTRTGCWPGNSLFQSFIRQSPEYRNARGAGLSDQAALRQLATDGQFVDALCHSKTQIQAGFVAIDPRNGDIKAWVGSRDFHDEPFDHVQQARRQPGSTFKPFVYGAAFADGAQPSDTFVDRNVAIALKGNAVWRPTDAEPPTGRPMSLRDALAFSRNRVTAQLMQRESPARVAALARAMGVRESPLDTVPSLALGTSPVTLKEMVSAYCTIENRGAYIEPRMVTRIEDREGHVLADFPAARPEQALPSAAALKLVDVMRDVVDRGTGTDIRTRFGIRADVAGKTGTTQGNTDSWFILIHPELVAGAWVGFDDARVTLRSDYWGAGAHAALPMVGAFYDMAMRSKVVDARAQLEPPREPVRRTVRASRPRARHHFLFWSF
ncbi:penicillin-binding protein 1A [Paraburkholderia tagetis]|uniref:Transglycosylase domain-containing protein n=1 Tax=Paraburkholderia tagetis TaxID=2913261 RepID=A0A9X1RTW0_9BURK|nr:transglycosylase domain-containing protein [Paraburkholderia tagetis]MCG5076790.1 transglycosylase domain-containing protein [Paraburkholderia tagetis]